MSAAQNITRHFKGDWHTTYGSIPAPGHGKSDRGVTVKDADNGGVVFNSFNDADWRKLKDECRALGLLPARERERGTGAWRETGSYVYANEHGEVLYRTRRLERTGERKKFIAERLEAGQWVSGLNGVERLLYRLPEIKAAINRAVLKDETLPLIYFVEGERKADKLVSWGLLATAVAFGAKGWREAYAQALAGCTVVILPDNDQPGHDFAAAAAADITTAGGRALLVDLPGLGEGEDIINWKGSAEDLGELTAKAVAGESAAPDTFELADLALWSRVPPTPKAFFMAPFVPQDDVVIITGDGGTNKSTLALQLSACSAAGKQMLGMDVAPGPALYLTAEDDDRENHWRLAKIAAAVGTSIDRLVDRLHIVSLRGRLSNELATFEHDGKLRPAPAYALLRATIEMTGAKLVTLDNVAHLFNGNENDRGQVTAFINLLYRLCGYLGVTILLIAHRNKNGDSYSGSTAWLNAVRSQILIERSNDRTSTMPTFANYFWGRRTMPAKARRLLSAGTISR